MGGWPPEHGCVEGVKEDEVINWIVRISYNDFRAGELFVGFNSCAGDIGFKWIV